MRDFFHFLVPISFDQCRCARYSPRMATRPILNKDEPLLREIAAPVPASLFGTKELAGMIKNMQDTLDGEPDGVALAAPQIGIPYRIFVARFERTLPPPKEDEPPHAPLVGIFINPEIIRTSKRRAEVDEGCLSVRDVYGKTRRFERATVRAYDEQGKPFERGGGGIIAQIFQHETDHLNGILFIDTATDLVQMAHDAPTGPTLADGFVPTHESNID